jgi:hypothetical protein
MASAAGLASLLRFFVVAKLCPLWGKSKPCLPNYGKLLPIYYLEMITATPLSYP